MKFRALRTLAIAAFTTVGAASCTDNIVAPSRTDRGSLFDELWNEFDLHYSYFQVRNVDWTAIGAKYRPLAVAATTDDAFAHVLGDMLAELHDVHVSITPAGKNTLRYQSQYEVSPLGYNPTAALSKYAATTSFTTDGGHIRGGIVSPHVGYLQITTFLGDGWSGEIDQALETLGKVSSAIIDVRNNGGGSKAIATDIAGRFADHQHVFGYVRLRNGPKHTDFTGDIAETVEPRGTHFSGRVIVLANRRSMSSAEDFVLAMRSLPNTIIMGDTTAGASAGPLMRELSNGWTYSVSQWVAYTADHKMFEAIGLAPDVVVKPSPEAVRSASAANDLQLERAISALEN